MAHTHTNKHADIPGAAVRTQTHDSWQCLHGPRPKSGPADRRQMRLCLKHTGKAMCKHTETHITSQATKALLTVYFPLANTQD